MDKIKKYIKIISSNTEEDLKKEVESHEKEGWVMEGKMWVDNSDYKIKSCFAYYRTTCKYSQLMVKFYYVE